MRKVQKSTFHIKKKPIFEKSVTGGGDDQAVGVVTHAPPSLYLQPAMQIFVKSPHPGQPQAGQAARTRSVRAARHRFPAGQETGGTSQIYA